MIPESAAIPEAEARAIIAMPKAILGNVEWKNNPTGSAFFKATFVVYDENGATIPGINVELSYRHSNVANECNHKFTVFKVKGTRPLRAYQIEVYPPTRQSHRENGVAVFGPHQHIGEKYEPIAGVAALTCADYESWMQEYFGRANIKFAGNYSPPELHAGQLELGI